MKKFHFSCLLWTKYVSIRHEIVKWLPWRQNSQNYALGMGNEGIWFFVPVLDKIRLHQARYGKIASMKSKFQKSGLKREKWRAYPFRASGEQNPLYSGIWYVSHFQRQNVSKIRPQSKEMKGIFYLLCHWRTESHLIGAGKADRMSHSGTIW